MQQTHFGTLKQGEHSKCPLMAFTEQRVAMLSTVLDSTNRQYINIQIMRVFTRIRQMLTDNTELRLEIAEIKNVVEKVSKK